MNLLSELNTLPMDIIIFATLGVLVFAFLLIGFLSRYKMCPPDKVLVVYGNIGGDRSSKCYNGGATFVLPIFQSCSYLNLRPMNLDVPLKGALSAQNIRVNTPASFTIGISTQDGVMENAATRLLGLPGDEIESLAKEIIIGQMRVVIASMTIEEINADREKLIRHITEGVDVELNKVGLRMINCNITDITDDSGYIEALGREAAARAINDANIKVADETKKGEIGRANAQREQAIAVANALADARAGENAAAVRIADSESQLAVSRAEASRISETAVKIQEAKVLEEGFKAQQLAQAARAALERSTLEATRIVPAKIAKEEAEINAEAEAEKTRRIFKGQADALRIQKEAEGAGMKSVLEGEAQGIRAKLLAEADGARAALEGRAQGFEKLVGVAGDSASSAVQLLLTERIVELARVQSEAIRGLTFEKIVALGENSPGNFVNGLLGNVLSLHEIARSAGIELPDYLGKSKEAAKPKPPQAPPDAG
ncbi:MAG: SPFH domain-containing protein [Terrimicrobiaceae bacterium]|nr:SPFH domain-containing protein [Terrimicrobiaceae bacterium]